MHYPKLFMKRKAELGHVLNLKIINVAFKFFQGRTADNQLELRPSPDGVTYNGIQIAKLYGNLPKIAKAIRDVEEHKLPNTKVTIDIKREIHILKHRGMIALLFTGEARDKVKKFNFLTNKTKIIDFSNK